MARVEPSGEGEGEGRRRHGKPQLRIDEARRWTAKALELAAAGEAGAVAAMMALLMNMRCSEIISRVARDVDDSARVLWITVSKTEAGRRTFEVPGVLVPHLRRVAEGKKAEALLFGRHWRDWPRAWVKRICDLAGVPRVCAHAMRGAHASLATERGVTAHAVAAALDHESETTTLRSYATPAAVATGRQRRLIDVLAVKDLADNDSRSIVVHSLSSGREGRLDGSQPSGTTLNISWS